MLNLWGVLSTKCWIISLKLWVNSQQDISFSLIFFPTKLDFPKSTFQSGFVWNCFIYVSALFTFCTFVNYARRSLIQQDLNHLLVCQAQSKSNLEKRSYNQFHQYFTSSLFANFLKYRKTAHNTFARKSCL